MSKLKFEPRQPPLAVPSIESWVDGARPQNDKPSSRQAVKPRKLTVYVPPDVFRRFSAQCSLEDRTLSAVVAELLDQWTRHRD